MKPILFNSEMVRAILDGRKTQTRRAMKPQPTGLPEGAYCDPYNRNLNHFTFWTRDNKMILGCGGNVKHTCHWKPCYQVGDKLWVREAFAKEADGRLVYRADRAAIYSTSQKIRGSMFFLPSNYEPKKWTPSIHMPRWASRITLEVTAVRVERVQDISAEDAISEGINFEEHKCGCERCAQTYEICPASAGSLIEAYASLWDSINGKTYSRASNPYVWVYEFRKE